jgi:hypothetical protein
MTGQVNIRFNYATQSILGDAAAVRTIELHAPRKTDCPPDLKVYRFWILWSRDYRVIIIPTIMLIASTSEFLNCI